MIFPEKVPVLIVGGGIVGLSAALFLQQQNVPFLLIERHRGTSIHPRARGVNARTMELYRVLGIDEEVRIAGRDIDLSIGFLKGESLMDALKDWYPSSEQHQRMRAIFANAGANLALLSPTTGNRCTQDLLEPVLLATARRRGGDPRFYTELVSFEQDESGVIATIVERESGTLYTIHADYMIAADGANSPVRAALDVPTSGRGSQGYLFNILFKADLRELVRGREFSICTIEGPEVNGMFTSINNADRWVFHLAYDPTKGERPEDYPPTRCIEELRRALGIPEIEIEILSILPWSPTMRVADRFQHGRIFLAGDAAHQMTPWGGMGANTGIQDVHNLAWKLAAVLNGSAASTLLETYDVERYPVGYAAAEASSQIASPVGGTPNVKKTENNANPFEDKKRAALMLGLGYQYRDSQAIVVDDATSISEVPVLDGQPGTRAPHLWVERAGQRLSTIDLFERDFVLLTSSEGVDWVKAARTIATELNINLVAYRIGADGDLLDPDNRWPVVAGIGATGALLVRPDGFVAWRSVGSELASQQELERVLRQILGQMISSAASQS
jgi:putative polyketide hydroxylase